jgi:hypothetical protein
MGILSSFKVNDAGGQEPLLGVLKASVGACEFIRDISSL